jgi:hypothetical protein
LALIQLLRLDIGDAEQVIWLFDVFSGKAPLWGDSLGTQAVFHAESLSKTWASLCPSTKNVEEPVILLYEALRC